MNLASGIMKEVFEMTVRNDLKHKIKKIYLLKYVIKTASLVNARVWNNLPNDIKECISFELLKSKIKNWNP